MGAWVAQSVKYSTLDLSIGLDVRVVSPSPTIGSTPTLKKRKKERNGNKLYA